MTGGPPAADGAIPVVDAAAQLVRDALAIEAGHSLATASLDLDSPERSREVVEQLARQRVVPLVASAAGLLGLSDAVRDELRACWLAESGASLPVQAAAVALVGELNDAGVRCLAYKGVALAAATTGDPAARGGGDLDLLVHPDDVVAAFDWLVDGGAEFIAGYCPDPHSDLWGSARQVNCEFPMRWRGVDIDVHWRFDRLPQIASMPFDDLWDRREYATVGGRQLPTLASVDALLVTCAHGTKEHWRQWRWVVDLVRQARGVDDWAQVLRRSAETGTEPSLAVGLAIHEYLAPLPAGLGLTPGPRPRRLAAWAWANSCAQEAPFGSVAVNAQVERLRWSFETLPSASTIGSFALRQGWTSLDMAEFPMPRQLVWAYPFVRPFLWGRRLATGRYGGAVLAAREGH